MTIQVKIIEQYFLVVLFIVRYKVVLTFEFVDELFHLERVYSLFLKLQNVMISEKEEGEINIATKEGQVAMDFTGERGRVITDSKEIQELANTRQKVVSVGVTSLLLGFCITELCDWLKKLTPLSQPIRSENKTSEDLLRVFPRLASVTCICFEF